MSDLFIARATEEALPACFALLPMLADPDSVLFTARRGDGTLVGAAGLIWRGWNDPTGYPAWVHVLPDSRRQQVGRALLAALIAHGTGELDTLWAAQPLAEQSEGAAFARACGFATDHRQIFYEADARTFLGPIARTVELLTRRGRIPDSARFAGIADVPLDDLARLVASEFPAAPPHIAALLRKSVARDGGDGLADPVHSRVLIVDGGIAGALLSRRAGDGQASIICNVVAPAWRKGWANAALLHDYTRAAVAAGCHRIGFDCRDDVHDTIGLAERSEADHVRTESWFRYALSAAAC